MDAKTLTADLHSEYGLLVAALAATDPAASVPTCPGWTAADLSSHVAMVYLHKVECIETLAFPTEWPPPGDSVTLPAAFARLTEVLAAHQPSDPAKTFANNDQTVGFWIRRMAQETLVHRIDAELTAGMPVTPVSPELAADGVDEVLALFLAEASLNWPEEFADTLATADRRPVRLITDGLGWDVVALPDRVVVTAAEVAAAGVTAAGVTAAGVTAADDTVTAGASISGSPEAVLRWLWNRGDGGVTVEGDAALVSQLRKLLVIATQ